jgi:UDP-glucose 4-epimerase
MKRDVPRVVAITGASGYLGGLLADRLVAEPGIERIIDVDVRPPQRTHDGRVVFVEADVRGDLASRLSPWPIDTIVHMAYPLNHVRSMAEIRPFSVDATKNVLAAADATSASHVVLCSSTTVYGGHADGRAPYRETALPRPNDEYFYAQGKCEAEELTLAWAEKRVGRVVTIVRPGIILGSATDNYMSSAFVGTNKIVAGTDPALQFLHEADFADAFAAILLKRAGGIFNLTPSDAVHRSELLALLNIEPIPVSRDELHAELAARWDAKLPDAVSPAMLDLMSYAWTADNTKLRQVVGFEPRHGSIDSVLAHFQAHRARRRLERRSKQESHAR